MKNLQVTLKDRDYYKRAVWLAQYGEHRVRVGAVATVNGKPTSGAFNRIRNTTKVNYTDLTRHAEMLALSGLAFEDFPKRVGLFVARINLDGKEMPSFPCDRCLKDLYDLVNTVVYFDGVELKKVRL